MNGQSFMIGIVVPDIVNPYFAEIAHGAVDCAWDHGYKALLCESGGTSQREQAALHVLKDAETDGVILCDACLPDDVLRRWVQAYQGVVLFDHPLPGAAVGSVRINSSDGMQQAIQHLLGMGRKHLGFLAADSSSVNRKEQLSGFLQAADHQAVDADRQVVCASTWEGGYTSARNLLNAHPEVDGLICHNDFVAAGALHACVGLDKHVPRDVAIVGCDDVLIARVARPALTTLHVPKYEVGAIAVRLLLERIDGCQTQDEIVVAQKLVVRASAP